MGQHYYHQTNKFGILTRIKVDQIQDFSSEMLLIRDIYIYIYIYAEYDSSACDGFTEVYGMNSLLDYGMSPLPLSRSRVSIQRAPK